MRIGINALYLIPSQVGGSETYLTELLKAICSGYPKTELVIFTHADNDTFLRKKFGHYPQVLFSYLNFHARNRPMRIIREQIELPFRAKKAKIDLLFSSGYTAPYFCHCPQVVVIHDMQYKNFPEDLSWLARATTDGLVSFASKKCDAVITGSEFSGRELLKHTALREDRLHVIPYGANQTFSQTLSSEEMEASLRNIEGLKKPYLLCVAYSFPHKNLPLMFEAFFELLNEMPHQLILVGGEGRGEKRLQQVLEKFPTGRVLRLKGIPQKQLVALYQGAEGFILPSRYEGFGFPVLEALQSGLPVVTTQCGSIPEIAGQQAIYFHETDKNDLKNKMRELASLSKEERKEYSEKGKKQAAGFSWEVTAQKTVACFAQILERSHRSR